MPELYSIPVTLTETGRFTLKGSWVIPAEAEAALQRHYPNPDVTLEKVFNHRLAGDSFVYGWDWMLVVLPKRYPIGGRLALARGPKANMILLDHDITARRKIVENPQGYQEAPWVPSLPKANWDVHVSMFWVATKGLLSAMGERNGGWLADLARQVIQVPATGHWVYFADAPPQQWVDSIRQQNAHWFRCWAHYFLGPRWTYDLTTPVGQRSRYLLATACAAQGDQRIHLLRKYLKYQPADVRAWATLAQQFYLLGRPWRALVAARKAHDLHPSWLFPMELIALCEGSRGRAESMVALCRTILSRWPLHVPALEWLVRGLRQLGATQERLLLFEQLVNLSPPTADILVDYGFACYQAGRLDDASAAFDRAVFIDPMHGTALNNLAYTLAEQGDLDRALSMCHRACAIKVSTHSLDTLGFVYMRLGYIEKARIFFKRALELDPHNVMAQQHLAAVENDDRPGTA